MLNKLITLIIIILFIGCNNKTTYKFNRGDIVYLKPDSIKSIILYPQYYGNNTYIVAYFDSLKVRNISHVYEYEIYDLNKK